MSNVYIPTDTTARRNSRGRKLYLECKWANVWLQKIEDR